MAVRDTFSMRKTEERIAGLKRFWNEYKRYRIGVFGMVLLVLFVLIGLLAPWLAPHNPSPLNRVGADYAAPSWMATFDPDAFPTENVVQNGDFSDLSGWRVEGDFSQVATGDQIQDGFDGESFRITVSDQGSATSETGYIALTQDIHWPNNREPLEVLLRQALKTESQGDYSFPDFKIRLVFVPPNYNDFTIPEYMQYLMQNDLLIPLTDLKPYGVVVETLSSQRTRWDEITFNPNFAEIAVAFDNQSTFQFRYVVEYNVQPEKTGSFSLYLDNLELEVFSAYFGLLGTTNTGADLFSQILWGARPSLIIGLAATAIAISIGLTVGLVAGYFRGRPDELLMRFVDFLIIIPGLPLLIVLAVIFGRSINTIIIAIGILAWGGTARLIRSQVLSEREKAYVEAARAVGASGPYVMFRHILPNVVPLIFVQISTGVAGAILTEVGLSFLGLGPTTVTWGRMLQAAFQSSAAVRGAWWFIVFPGLAVGLLAMAFIFMGYSLNRVLNPRLRER